jgi:trans-aconitate methyltransferase
LGYKVLRTEAAKSFVSMMEKQGHEPLLLNALTDDYGGPYDLIYANAVLLHFTRRETETVLHKALGALVPGGLFAIRMKEGEGSEWDTAMRQARFMQYWRSQELEQVVKGAGFEVVYFEVGHSKFNKFGWLQVIARKSLG